MYNCKETNGTFTFYGVNFDALCEQECMQKIQAEALKKFLTLGENALSILEGREDCSVLDLCCENAEVSSDDIDSDCGLLFAALDVLCTKLPYKMDLLCADEGQYFAYIPSSVWEMSQEEKQLTADKLESDIADILHVLCPGLEVELENFEVYLTDA